MPTVIVACILVLIGTIAIAGGIVTTISIVNSWKCHQLIKKSDTKSLLFSKSCSKCNTWFLMSVLWQTIEYLLVVLPFELSASILYIEVFESDATAGKQNAIVILSVLAMTFVIVTYVLNPHRHVEGYRKAFTKTDYEINRYLATHDEKCLAVTLHHSEMEINEGFSLRSNEPQKIEVKNKNRKKRRKNNSALSYEMELEMCDEKLTE